MPFWAFSVVTIICDPFDSSKADVADSESSGTKLLSLTSEAPPDPSLFRNAVSSHPHHFIAQAFGLTAANSAKIKNFSAAGGRSFDIGEEIGFIRRYKQAAIARCDQSTGAGNWNQPLIALRRWGRKGMVICRTLPSAMRSTPL